MRATPRTVLRPTTLPGTISIHSAKPLTKKEAVDALDSVLALNGVVMINMGENFVKAVPAAQADKEGAPIDKFGPGTQTVRVDFWKIATPDVHLTFDYTFIVEA